MQPYNTVYPEIMVTDYGLLGAEVERRRGRGKEVLAKEEN